MDPFVKKSKKKARKAGAEAKPAVQTDVNPPAEKYTSSWEEEQRVDYEPEEPARFSPAEEDIYSGEDSRPTEMGRLTISLLQMISPPIWRRVQTWRGGNARKIF